MHSFKIKYRFNYNLLSYLHKKHRYFFLGGGSCILSICHTLPGAGGGYEKKFSKCHSIQFF